MLVGPYLSHPLTRNMKNAHGYTRQGRRSELQQQQRRVTPAPKNSSLRKDVLAAKAESTLRSFPSKWRRGLGKHPPRRTSKSQNMAGTLARHLPARKRISGRYRDVVKSCVSHFLMNCDLITLVTGTKKISCCGF